MTFLAEVQDKANYSQYLDHGFIGLVNSMGSDESIEFATRMSYGVGTRKVSDRRALIRYLVRHFHTSPIEMGEVVFHLKVPIFVMRQLVRHRTASLNEYSARYSELTDEFYVPPLDRIQKQSKTNKQGSGAHFSTEEAVDIIEQIIEAQTSSLHTYQQLISEEVDFARELARGVMPVNGYTEVVWKCDLKNFLHMCNLRMDPHAQQEIVDLATVMYNMVKVLFPLVCEAFEDYWFGGYKLSRFELQALQEILRDYGLGRGEVESYLYDTVTDPTKPLSKREVDDFVNKFVI